MGKKPPFPAKTYHPARKFGDAKKHYNEKFIFPKKKIKQVVIVGFSHPRHPADFGKTERVLIPPDFVRKWQDPQN